MPRETSWANKQQQNKQVYEPPEISDVEDDHSDIGNFIAASVNQKSPFGNQFHNNNERSVDVPNDFKPAGNPIAQALMSSIPKRNDEQKKKKEDLVDLEDFSDSESTTNTGRSSSKFQIPNALVKPIVETKPHHGLGSGDENNDRDTPIYENADEYNNTGPFSKISLQNPKKDSTPLKYPASNVQQGKIQNATTNKDSDSTEYENETDDDDSEYKPSGKAKNEASQNIHNLSGLVNKNTNQNSSFYEDVSEDVDDIENEILNIINKKPTPKANSTNNHAISSLVQKVVTNPKPLAESITSSSTKNNDSETKKMTNFNEIDKKQPKNSPKTNIKLESPKITEDYVENSTIGKLLYNFVPKNTNLFSKKDDIEPISDLESTSEMRTSKIEELITSLQPKTTWSQKSKPDDTNFSQNKENNSQIKQQDNYKVNSTLGALVTQNISLPKDNLDSSKPKTTDSSPVKVQQPHDSALSALVNQHMSLPKENKDLSKTTTSNTQKVEPPQDNKNTSALAALISQTIILPKNNVSTSKTSDDSSPVKQPLQTQDIKNSTISALVNQNISTNQKGYMDSSTESQLKQQNSLPQGNKNSANQFSANSSPVKVQNDTKNSALSALVNQHISLPKENEISKPTTSDAPKPQQDNKNSALATLVSQTIILPKNNADLSKPVTPDSSPAKQKQSQENKYSTLSGLVNQHISIPKGNDDYLNSFTSDSSPVKQNNSKNGALNNLVSQTVLLPSANVSKPPIPESSLIKPQINPNKKSDEHFDDEDDRKEEYLRQKRAEQEKALDMAIKKQKDHGNSLSSDFEDDDDENDVDVEEYDIGDNGIVVEPPIGFSINSGNISSSLGTFSPSVDNEIDLSHFKKKNNNDLKKGNLIDIVDISTSESDLFLRNDLKSSETNNFKKQFDLLSNSSTVVNQQLKAKQTEVLQLKQQLEEALNEKKQLENQLKASNDKKKDLEAVLESTKSVLKEKEKTQLDIGSKSNESDVILRKNSLMIKDLQNELSNLKNDKRNLESRLHVLQSNNKNEEAALVQSLNEQNEKYAIEIKALKNQIEELHTDRNKLSERKEELSCLLDESDSQLSEQKTVLKNIINKSELEKAMMKTENVKLKNELTELNEQKKKLIEEIQQLKLELRDVKFEIEKLTKEKQELEKGMDREARDKENIKKKYESEVSSYKDQQLQLIEKLGFTEAKLVSAEKEYKYCKNTLQEKQAQLDELKGTLTKINSELNVQEGLLNKEKEEKIRLSAKNESIEDRLRNLQEENNNLKREHSDFVETSKYEKIHTISLKELERKKIDSEKEVNLLKQDLDILNQKLHNAELELKNEKHGQVSMFYTNVND